jgi:hypothetical protein
MRAWQAKWDSAYTGRFAYSIFPDVTLRPWFEGQKEERRLVCTVSRVLSGHCSGRSHLGRFQIVEDLMFVCAKDYETVDHLIWHCERFRLERHCLIDALAALNVSIGILIRDFYLFIYFFIHQQAIAQMITKEQKKRPLQKQTRTNYKKYISR